MECLMKMKLLALTSVNSRPGDHAGPGREIAQIFRACGYPRAGAGDCARWPHLAGGPRRGVLDRLHLRLVQEP